MKDGEFKAAVRLCMLTSQRCNCKLSGSEATHEITRRVLNNLKVCDMSSIHARACMKQTIFSTLSTYNLQLLIRNLNCNLIQQVAQHPRYSSVPTAWHWCVCDDGYDRKSSLLMHWHKPMLSCCYRQESEITKDGFSHDIPVKQL